MKEICIFSLVSNRATGAYQFQTGVYGLSDMPAQIQKANDLTLTNCMNRFAFLDDILVVTKGKKADHQLALRNVSERLNKKNFKRIDMVGIYSKRKRNPTTD